MRFALRDSGPLAYARFSTVGEPRLSHLVQTELPPTPSRTAWSQAIPLWQVLALTALSLWLYGPTLSHLIVQWWQDPNFSHGFFVPAFSAFVVWQRRTTLAQLSLRPSWTGAAILVFALMTLIIGQMGAEIFLARFSLLLLLAGIVVLFLGWNHLQILFFPLSFLVLMIPIPTIIFNQITFPLQLLASRVAATVLPWMGVPVLREGNIIVLPAMALEVAEACSGIRSLMSLITLAVIYGYLMEKRMPVRLLLAVAAVPIAVLANSLRIIGTGLLVQFWDPAKAEGFFHLSWGWIIFVVSLLMLYLVHIIISRLWPGRVGSA